MVAVWRRTGWPADAGLSSSESSRQGGGQARESATFAAVLGPWAGQALAVGMPAAQVDLITGDARATAARAAMSNSFAFGGSNVSLITTLA